MRKNLEMYEVNIPAYLQEDLNVLKCSNPNTCISYDMYWDLLNSSVNCAEIDDEISIGQARYLRQRYLGLERVQLYGFYKIY